MSQRPKVFIDGEAGTTGLQIAERLARRDDLELLRIDAARRKDNDARAAMLNTADVAILCLPDEAAREAVALVDNPETRIIDASTAHRVVEDWCYGFPELHAGHRAAMRASRRIANPGCYALAAIAILHPLIKNGVVPRDWPVSINAVSGYSGGGKQLIAAFEGSDGSAPLSNTIYDYALGLAHKHIPEITHWSGLQHPPVFQPAVGHYYKGMLVHVPLHLWALPEPVDSARIREVYTDHYAGERFVSVATADEVAALERIDPEDLNGSNELKLHVLGNDARGQAIVVAQLDNLGKGASGQAVQTLNLLLGVDETTGL